MVFFSKPHPVFVVDKINFLHNELSHLYMTDGNIIMLMFVSANGVSLITVGVSLGMAE